MFQPVLPLSGLPGWVLLNRTLESQTEAFNASPQIVRDTAYFVENIGNVRTAAELVSARRLLTVALGAFGLDDAITTRALIQKVLEDGTADPASLATRVSARTRASLALATALQISFRSGVLNPPSESRIRHCGWRSTRHGN